MVDEHVGPVARVAIHTHEVLGFLTGYHKGAVFSPIPTVGHTLTQVKSKLVSVVLGQLMKQLIAQPEVAVRVVESKFVLLPRTVENVRSVDMLLDQ